MLSEDVDPREVRGSFLRSWNGVLGPDVDTSYTSKIHVVVDGPFKLYGSSTISGVFYVTVEGDAFPWENYQDLPLKVLCGWLGEVAAMISGSKRQAVFYFMDDPKGIRLTGLREGQSTAEFLQDTFRGRVKMTANINLFEFAKGLLSAAERVVEEVQEIPDVSNAGPPRSDELILKYLSILKDRKKILEELIDN